MSSIDRPLSGAALRFALAEERARVNATYCHCHYIFQTS
jgi:hypothetical protein